MASIICGTNNKGEFVLQFFNEAIPQNHKGAQKEHNNRRNHILWGGRILVNPVKCFRRTARAVLCESHHHHLEPMRNLAVHRLENWLGYLWVDTVRTTRCAQHSLVAATVTHRTISVGSFQWWARLTMHIGCSNTWCLVSPPVARYRVVGRDTLPPTLLQLVPAGNSANRIHSGGAKSEEVSQVRATKCVAVLDMLPSYLAPTIVTYNLDADSGSLATARVSNPS